MRYEIVSIVQPCLLQLAAITSPFSVVLVSCLYPMFLAHAIVTMKLVNWTEQRLPF